MYYEDVEENNKNNTFSFFTLNGIVCSVFKHPLGVYNGYAYLPKDHKLYNNDDVNYEFLMTFTILMEAGHLIKMEK